MYSKEQKQSLDEIEGFVTGLADKYKARLVVLFGSRIKGTWTESSDYDLLVISDNLPANPLERFSDVDYPPLNVQLFGYTTDEVDRMLDNLNMFLFSALTEGKVVYADKGYYANIRNKLDGLKNDNSIVPIESGWSFKVPA
jgi:uncharacterized protein